MIDFSTLRSEFLKKVILKIDENLSDQQFGVSELADELNMSRSNLLRKIKNATSLSVSQLIRQVRLNKSRELLDDDSLTITQVSYKVGFSSTSYYIKCFKEEYGHPPGEMGKRELEEIPTDDTTSKRVPVRSLILGLLVVAVVLIFFWFQGKKKSPETLEKSIAVLPFKNDSNDSSNVYIVNGLMEAILDHLQKIEKLRVVSRTSVEQYRNSTKSIDEMSKELDVNYFIEGSGQKIGDQISLTVQLIEAPRDRHIWSERYEREATDIFQLQTDVAKNIANKIEVIITPEEEERIDKIPTENLVAYDYYLKGLELTRDETGEGLINAIDNFEKAITEDDEFAHAYAYIAVCYYYLDIFQIDKQFGDKINTYADKAMLLDAQQPECLIAKALYYMQDKQYELAVEYLEKVLEYSPNSGWVINFLADIYTSYLPNTEKYLKHALKASRLVMGEDSTTASYSYLHLSNALAQTGFLKESEKYVKKSLDYNPSNHFSEYLYAYILLAQDGDLERTKDLLLKVLEQDTTRLDVIQEVAKVYYYLEDFNASMKYYDDFIAIKEAADLDIYNAENAKIGYVMDKVGRIGEAKTFIESFKAYAENDQSIYKSLSLSAYHAHHGKADLAIEQLNEFSDQENYQFWIVLFLRKDPLLQNLKEHPDFDAVMSKIENKFWERHKQTRIMLEKEGLL